MDTPFVRKPTRPTKMGRHLDTPEFSVAHSLNEISEARQWLTNAMADDDGTRWKLWPTTDEPKLDPGAIKNPIFKVPTSRNFIPKRRAKERQKIRLDTSPNPNMVAHICPEKPTPLLRSVPACTKQQQVHSQNQRVHRPHPTKNTMVNQNKIRNDPFEGINVKWTGAPKKINVFKKKFGVIKINIISEHEAILTYKKQNKKIVM